MIENLAIHQEEELCIERIFDASPEKVFMAWTDPNLLKRWWGGVNNIVEEIEMDVRVGGQYHIGVKHKGEAIHYISGTYQVIEPHYKLEFTWFMNNPVLNIGNSLVTIKFHAKGTKTQIYLTHKRLPNHEAKVAHNEGWNSVLLNLTNYFKS